MHSLPPSPGRRVALAILLFGLALPATASHWVYTVVEGDNLWDFSTRYLDSTLRFEQLRRLNNIEFPKRMRPGSRIRVPMKWIRSNPVEARIDALEGDVKLVRASGSTDEPVSAGTTLRLGDMLSTGPSSSVAIRFADDSIITLHQSSQMRFDHLSAHGETGMVDSRMHLLEGRLDTRVEPAVGPGSRFEIQTPSAISAVRGTAYRAAITDTEQLTTNIEVIEGRVAVSGAEKAKLVKAGFGTQVAFDQVPAEPRPLLPAPKLAPIPQPIRQMNWSLSWEAVDRAHAYRVEIGVGTGFDVLAWEQRVNRPRLPLPDLPDGEYRARVRAIDDRGLEGKDRLTSLHFDTHPRPPVPLQPVDGKVLRGTAARLKWSSSAEATRYLLEIASDAAFTVPVSRHPALDATDFDTASITRPGTYFWRVSSIAEDGETGPPSDVRHWILKPEPEGVETTLSGDEDTLTASWRRAKDPVRYQVQLAFDPEFEEFEFDRTIDKAQVTFEPIQGQVRYLRVRSIEDDGYRGPWGTVQRIDPVEDPTAWLIPALGVLGLLLL